MNFFKIIVNPYFEDKMKELFKNSNTPSGKGCNE